MKPVYMSIQQEKTGRRIKSLLTESGYTVKDIQGALGFENPQAIYKWLSGKSLPNLDNFIILSRLLNTSIEDILVIDGDVVRLMGFCQHFPGPYNQRDYHENPHKRLRDDNAPVLKVFCQKYGGGNLARQLNHTGKHGGYMVAHAL